MISRHIGYQEKKAKQSTAPMRKPCADVLRLALRPRLTAARDRVRCGASSASRKIATMAPPWSVDGPAGRPWGVGPAGRDQGLLPAAVGQDLVDLARRGGQ